MNLPEAHEINNNTNNDKLVLETYLKLVEPDNTFYIDIGSSYPGTHNLQHSRIIDSENTIFFECDPEKNCYYKDQKFVYWELDNFHLTTTPVNPYNIIDLIENITDNKTPKLLDLDIDGYDYFVLKSILGKMTPTIIMAEINEKIPPPIKFTVKYDKDYWWDTSHFYGMSLSKLYELINEYDYELINLTFNNAYMVHKDKNPGFKSYSEEEAYDRFYRYAGWESLFHYNENWRCLLQYEPEKSLVFLNNTLKKYEGKYELYI